MRCWIHVRRLVATPERLDAYAEWQSNTDTSADKQREVFQRYVIESQPIKELEKAQVA